MGHMQLNTWLHWGIIGGVLATFLLPFFVADGLLFPFITGKNFAFRILVEIVFTLWVLLLLRDSSYRPPRSYLLYALGAFILSLGVSALLGANPDKSFWSNFERMEGWISLVHFGAFFVVLTSVFKTEKLWKWLLNLSIGASVVMAFYGIFQLLGFATINQGGVRVDGTFGNATYLAVYMLFHVFLTMLAYWWWGRGNRSWGIFYGLATFLQIVIIFYTATRGTILGLIGGLIIAGGTFLVFGNGSKRLRNIGIGILVAIVVATAGFFAIKDTAFVQNHGVLSRLANISISEGSTRFTIWGMALQGVQEKPIFGWGQENFNYIFNKYYEPSLYAQEPWFDRAHNVIFDWLVAGGFVGLILYFSLFGFALWYLWRPGSPFAPIERGLFTGLLAAYTFHNIFVFDNLMSYVMFLTVLGYIVFRSSHNTGAPSSLAPATSLVPEKSFVAIAPFVVLVMAGVFYFANVPGIVTARSIIQGISPHTEGLTKNLEYFQTANEQGGLGQQELRENLLRFVIQVGQLNAGDQAFRNQVATFGFQAFTDELTKNPDDTRLQLFFGSYLRQLGDTKNASIHLTKALELSPRKQQIMFELAIMANDAGDLKGALEWFKKAFDLDPRYDTARNFYAATAIRLGDRALSNKLLMDRYNMTTPDDGFILQAYIDVKDFGSVLAISKLRSEKNPLDAKMHLELAAAYLQAGDRPNSILEIRTAIELDPTFKEQGEFYISEIQAGRNP